MTTAAEKKKARLRMRRWNKLNPTRAREIRLKATHSFRERHPARTKQHSENWKKRNPIAYAKLRARLAADFKKRRPHYLAAYKSGISEEDIAIVFSKARGVCFGCGARKKLVFDHCHKTKKARGAICSPCNVAIAMAKDSPVTLRKLASYLENANGAAKCIS